MLILIFFAFIAGVVTILSPCILPLLPIILSSGISKDKSRPYGIVIGFVLSFTFFTLFLTSLVKLTGIPANTLRSFSIIVLFIFGLSLIIPKAQLIIEQLFVKLQKLIPNRTNQNPGFISGVIVGLSLGLLWAPCVGPILASVITIALSGEVTSNAIFITFSYSIGTAIPMLLIMVGGQKIFLNHKWLLNNSSKIQKSFGVIMIITSIAIMLNFDRKFQVFILDKFPSYGTGLTQIEDNSIVREVLDSLNPNSGQLNNMRSPIDLTAKAKFPAANIIAGGEWINSLPLEIDKLKGKVVLIDFWTYTCINCIRTLPYLKSWWEKYEKDGLVIIGVHTPEFEFEKDLNNVTQAVKDFGLKYPIVQDNNFSTWRAYQNQYWPAKYLIDKDGFIRYAHFGEGDYDETESMIQKLLSEQGEVVSSPIENKDYQIYAKTPELYAGTSRFVNGSMVFRGDWKQKPEYASPETNGNNYLELDFKAKEVFVVARTKSGSKSPFSVHLKGGNLPEKYFGDDVDLDTNYVWVESNRLYKLINLPSYGEYKLILEFPDNNIEIYAFTFG